MRGGLTVFTNKQLYFSLYSHVPSRKVDCTVPMWLGLVIGAVVLSEIQRSSRMVWELGSSQLGRPPGVLVSGGKCLMVPTPAFRPFLTNYCHSLITTINIFVFFCVLWIRRLQVQKLKLIHWLSNAVISVYYSRRVSVAQFEMLTNGTTNYTFYAYLMNEELSGRDEDSNRFAICWLSLIPYQNSLGFFYLPSYAKF